MVEKKKQQSASSTGQEISVPGRVVIENVSPEVDGGRFPIKRIVGEPVIVTADIFADGHDVLRAAVRFRKAEEAEWKETAMQELGNDRWQGAFRIEAQTPYLYTVVARVDQFRTWQRDLKKKFEAGQDVSVELLAGAQLLEEAAACADGAGAEKLTASINSLRAAHKPDLSAAVEHALNAELAALVEGHSSRDELRPYGKELRVEVDRERARFGAWYEMFPRSSAGEPGRHGTFKDCLARLPYVAGMGFDVLYLPPIHPIGKSYRKGKNNNPDCSPEDVGSPWAIGGEEGGHKSIHPELGTLEDFRNLVAEARKHGLEIALDIAFQCTPDHPYVKEHPQWFRWRPDGSVQYAENPPKKYQDIYPINFDTEDWRALWEELKSVVVYWIEQGVRILRVDNPHTKPFAFWEWLISDVKKRYPEVILLSEAFTRPRVMYALAKLGFTQSYTYFAWRNTKWELIQYFTELSQSEVREYFRPNLWPNTPDILTEYLQFGGRPAFMSRLVLAATLAASYGIYGPAFELCENRPLAPGSEEYLNSEKYEIRHWELDRPDSLKELIARVNRIRRENPALHQNHNLQFHRLDNDQLIAYSKSSEDESNLILVVVNLDPYHKQSGWLELPLESFGLSPDQSFQVHDLLSDGRYFWQGPRNYVELNPQVVPAHIFRVRRRTRTERDFDYFL
jgi:starch synthase (maltosyl-transferring)